MSTLVEASALKWPVRTTLQAADEPFSLELMEVLQAALGAVASNVACVFTAGSRKRARSELSSSQRRHSLGVELYAAREAVDGLLVLLGGKGAVALFLLLHRLGLVELRRGSSRRRAQQAVTVHQCGQDAAKGHATLTH